MASITVNASPLIILGRVNKIYLIYELFQKLGKYNVFITKTILEEVKTARAQLNALLRDKMFMLYDEPLPYAEVFKIAADVAINSARSLNPKDHLGEAEVIWLADKLRSEFIVIDEKAAKPVITGKGISHLTCLQVLDLCVKKGIISNTEALKTFRDIIKTVKYSGGVIDAYESKW